MVRARPLRWAPGGRSSAACVVIGLTGLVGTRDYLGLSLPLMVTAPWPAAPASAALAFALKLVFTAVTLGAGFQGGEVTPLFVIGATLGVDARPGAGRADRR